MSLYHSLTFAGTGIVWKFNDVVSGPEIGDPDAERIRERQNLQHERNRLAVEKYRRRRFKFSDYIAYYELSATSNTVRSRYIGDSESFVLGFERYIHVATWKAEYGRLVRGLAWVRWQQTVHMIMPDQTFYALLGAASVLARALPGTRSRTRVSSFISMTYNRMETDNCYRFEGPSISASWP